MATIGAKCFDTVNKFKAHYCKSNFSTTNLLKVCQILTKRAKLV